MRTHKLLLAIPLSTIALSVHAQKENAAKVNPIGALFGALSVGFEHRLSDHSSVQLGVRFFSRGYDVTGVDANGNTASGRQKFSGFGLLPEYRYYFDEALDGWYAGGFANWNSMTAKTTYSDNAAIGDSEATITNVGAGIHFGRQWLLGGSDSFVIDLNLGVGFQSASVDGTDEDDIEFAAAGSGIWPKFAFSVGYAF